MKVAPFAPATVMPEAAPALVAINVTPPVADRAATVGMITVPRAADPAKVPKFSVEAAVMVIGATTVAAVTTLVTAVDAACAFPAANKSPAQPKAASLKLTLEVIDGV